LTLTGASGEEARYRRERGYDPSPRRSVDRLKAHLAEESGIPIGFSRARVQTEGTIRQHPGGIAKLAIKKSDLYSSIWASCDELRSGMDASQYKDYVLFMLFVKYVSDKYADYDGFEPPIVIPKGTSFKDMAALKGDSDIGNKINT
jgi:HsdM N-terminal domain